MPRSYALQIPLKLLPTIGALWVERELSPNCDRVFSNLLSGVDRCAALLHRYDRAKLYQYVWSRPVQEVAKTYNFGAHRALAPSRW